MSNRFGVLAAVAGVGLAGSAMAAVLGPALDSASFASKYEGNVLPTAAGLGFALLDPNAIAGGANDPASLGTSGGVDYLRIDTDNNARASDGFWYQVNGGPATTWNPDDNALGGYTVEFRAIIRAANSAQFGFGVAMIDQNTDGLMQFFNDKVIGPNDSAALGAVPTAANNDTWHTFRIASYSPNDTNAGQIFRTWRDGVEIGQLAQNTNFLGEILRFGDFVSGSAEVNVDIDYLRWDTTGAYAPVPEPSTAMGLFAAGSGMLLRRRNVSGR